MPNWCDNRLAIRGAPATVMELVNLLEIDELLSFEALLPMPEHIREGGDYSAPPALGVGGLPGWYQ